MKSQRAELVAETAITLLAERGMRGLTHRAVDETAGLPPGSTSNLARTRSALLELTLERLAELEVAAFEEIFGAVGPDRPDAVGGPDGPSRPDRPDELGGLGALDALTEMTARALWAQLTVDRRRTVARYELALEATRRPELRKVYDEVGSRFRDPAAALLAAAGSPDPVRHGRQMVAFGEGVMFDAIVGAGAQPTLDDLRLGIGELLKGMLG
ncbi:transcriptional regulator, TetR family [Streptosporangium canum]|uniref:Transcriptional regulator, TetR family n=1 Tax=Streptosporangium canum TaxID=324952 RepID=A0A1I4E990_9ACTN|nr:TetR/AcrR family transcriptional regulator [Streptosporangium canum]SFL02332.1 transcriptional regulator, TetR family [Streptosporangium canum]